MVTDGGPGRALKNTGTAAGTIVLGSRLEPVMVAQGGYTFRAETGAPMGPGSQTKGGITSCCGDGLVGLMMGSMLSAAFPSRTKYPILKATFENEPHLFSRIRTGANTGGTRMLGFRRQRVNLRR